MSTLAVNYYGFFSVFRFLKILPLDHVNIKYLVASLLCGYIFAGIYCLVIPQQLLEQLLFAFILCNLHNITVPRPCPVPGQIPYRRAVLQGDLFTHRWNHFHCTEFYLFAR